MVPVLLCLLFFLKNTAILHVIFVYEQLLIEFPISYCKEAVEYYYSVLCLWNCNYQKNKLGPIKIHAIIISRKKKRLNQKEPRLLHGLFGQHIHQIYLESFLMVNHSVVEFYRKSFRVPLRDNSDNSCCLCCPSVDRSLVCIYVFLQVQKNCCWSFDFIKV